MTSESKSKPVGWSACVAAAAVMLLGAVAIHGASAATSSQDLLAANRDTTVSPAHDFFQYANGGWLARHPIPASESAWGIGNQVNEELYLRKRSISETAAGAGAVPGSDSQKIGDFWLAAMDTLRTDQLGAAPLERELRRIDAIRSGVEVVEVAAFLNRQGAGCLWSFGIGQDDMRSDVIAVFVSQGGLGLPDRDYYFNPEAGVVRARTEYPKHVARMLELAGAEPGEAQRGAAAVLSFETALATASRKLEDRRDPYKNYNKRSVAEVASRLTPHIAWRSILDGYGLSKVDTLIIRQPEFLTALDSLVMATPVADLRHYLRYQLLSTYAPYLGHALDQQNFAFYGTILDGRTTQRPHWKRALDAQEDALGMVMGKLFVSAYFPPRTKARYDKLVEVIRDSYRERIAGLEWMSAVTKRRATEKLDRMTKKVGYPARWKDFSTLRINRDSYAANVRAGIVWQFDDAVSKFGKPVDRTEWVMTPQTYNAYYNASNNEIVLPAGIFLIPGLKDDEADDALVYGYAGASTIGHEITHGFDDDGRQYDVAGNLSNWWTAADESSFKARAEVMSRQFDLYEPLPGLHINGRASLGENLADFGGVVLGLQAFKKTRQYREGKSIGGLTPVQRYFLGYALGWMSHQREERLRARLLSDVHAPAKWRVLGPMANLPEFYEAFGIREGDPMWRPAEARVRVW
ncbi:MAG: M13 family metallopeptidase [Candidatus Eisenbacteria bacterium]|uniref:M13 family metallopeptidase n=1 Tax=Eiseniibacteriota bacterium TaxID=2212470 RepID=A0A849SVH4_UNCEI|nr:M13 family metallopeptidase [Candidatus Eisenbacteria bacterium]